MKTSPQGIAEIAGHEGIVLSPYFDSVGVLTLGIGHTKAAGKPDPASLPRGVDQPLADILDIFRKDIAKYEAAVAKAVKVPVSQHQFDACVSFHINTGAIARAAFVKKLNAGDMAGAATGIMAWSKPKEIIPRRQAEQNLFRTGKYSGNGMATIYPANEAGKVQWNKGKRVNVLSLLSGIPLAPVLIPTPAPSYTLSQIKDVQKMLLAHGYVQVGGIDGAVGDMTKSAIRDFRANNGLPEGEFIDAALIEMLKNPDAVRPVIAPVRAEATVADLRAQGSEIVQGSDVTKIGAGAVAVGTAANRGVDLLTTSSEQVSDITEKLSPFQTFLQFAGDWMWVAILVIAGIVGWQAFKIARARLRDHRSGNTAVINLPKAEAAVK